MNMASPEYGVDAIGRPMATKEEEQQQMLPYHDMARSSAPECSQPTTTFNFPYPHFALLYINRNGELGVEASSSIATYEKAIFTHDVKERFLKTATVGWQPDLQNYHANSVSHMDGDVKPFLSNTSFQVGLQQQQQHHHHHHHQTGWYQPELIPCEWQSLQNKRHRRNLRRVGSEVGRDSDSNSPGATVRSTTFRLGQKHLLRSYYEKAFENFQQLNCRAIAKAFVKLVEPRKQVNHPYNGRKTNSAGSSQRVDPELTKPKWWPTGVTHKEPDHLLKAERIRLLVHILCELKESHGVTADKLKDAGQDVRRQIMPAERLRVLDEIYYVRKMEELYLDGKISGDTIIHVSHVHLAETSTDAELHEQPTRDSPNHLLNPVAKSKRDASNMSDNHKPNYEGDVHSSTEQNQPVRQPLNQGTACAPLSPLSSPSISRKSSLESSLTTYSSDLTSSMLSCNGANRVYASKDVNTTGSCMTGYFTTQQISTQASGQNSQTEFWNTVPQVAFPGY
ncbi:hypothetical protein BDV28DRAFT_7802 [Aspergillus coremiiformis]|uniref:Subtelomeric hrmA-associated cluster protein AFUB-079030/YDR124W-like helical bundle domain-containing protein n=1 Tax=Aspergillus coremiiformis TaxID=138285 RepID=A0A5N6Z610_9EURO|nr:hypothetical protein BDV28DRAFT_7802 [Aspergillus coremiiformis]